MSARPRLSVVLVTKDEEERLRPCLEAVAWADEIVVIDAESSDKTATIAREFTDRVLVRPWPGYAAQKNAAIELATGDWILSLDADEIVSAPLRDEIARVVAANGPSDGYAVPRRNIFWDRWVRHGGLYPDWQVRLFRRGRGRFAERAVHESVTVDGRVERLAGHLEHRSYRDVGDFLVRAERYATLAADEAVAQGRRAGPADLVVRPLGRFLAMYVAGAGFLDGWRGFLLAALYAYYVLIRSVKIWERTRG
ncbi:MAG TPA: glycosyltransferase family 2 protein [Methylomirabilota bacterium]|jgi:glycosyltransferase involved in cell wall biosynthesis|nr:glycosyltransferase family 2 protein [Methylomirabilota bacterium]